MICTVYNASEFQAILSHKIRISTPNMFSLIDINHWLDPMEEYNQHIYFESCSSWRQTQLCLSEQNRKSAVDS